MSKNLERASLSKTLLACYLPHKPSCVCGLRLPAALLDCSIINQYTLAAGHWLHWSPGCTTELAQSAFPKHLHEDYFPLFPPLPLADLAWGKTIPQCAIFFLQREREASMSLSHNVLSNIFDVGDFYFPLIILFYPSAIAFLNQ